MRVNGQLVQITHSIRGDGREVISIYVPYIGERSESTADA